MPTQFINISPEDISHLQTNDMATTEIIHHISTGGMISYNWLRNRFGIQNGTQPSLNRGRAIISSYEQLDQYLYSYGPMICSQWQKIYECGFVEFPTKHFRLIDYGCGQGLAGLLLSDKYGPPLFNLAPKIVLVEPSKFALTRAELIYRFIAPKADLFCVCKTFDNLTADELMPDKNLESVHIMSNVLDVEGYDQLKLFSKMLNVGRHSVIVVSHHRDHNGGSSRISSIKKTMESRQDKGNVKIVTSVEHEFKCDNPTKSDAILWFLKVDVM